MAFECGRFFYGIRDFAKALRYYTISSETIGEHHVTMHNMGLCYYSLGFLEDAIEHFKLSIGLNKNYAKAASWLEKVQKEVAVRDGKDEKGAGGEAEGAGGGAVEGGGAEVVVA